MNKLGKNAELRTKNREMDKVRVDMTLAGERRCTGQRQTEEEEMSVLCIKMQSLTSNSHIASNWLYIYTISPYLKNALQPHH